MKTKTYTDYTVVYVPETTPVSQIREAAMQQVQDKNDPKKVTRVWKEGNHYCVQISYTVTIRK